MSDEQKITLISNDSRRIEVPLDVARMSAVIAGQINDDDEDSEIENEFPCPKVSGNILQKVVDYCTHYQEEPMEKIETPLKGETIEAIVRPEWYVRFCDVDREVMCQLVAAANFLNIEPLLDLTCLAVSVSVKGKSVEELQEIFHLPAPDNSSLSVNASEQSQEENHQEESGTHNDKEASVMETATSSNTSTTTSNNISHNNTNNSNSNISISKKRTHAVANLKGDDSHDHHDPQRLKQQTTTKKSLTAKQEQSPSTWEKILKQYPRCCAATGIEETSVFRNKYQEPSTFSGNHKNSNYLRILMSELANLQETLPQSPAIWVRFDEDVPQYLRILITGPRGTPYSLGLFCFDLFVPTNYPNAPPVMKLLTTGRGTVRFSPNLYANGTVCLSLLNTWEGPKWRANQSTILQVLVSIQALILGTEHPYYLEPGRGGWEDGVKQQQQQQLQQQQNGKDPKPRPPPVHVLIHEDRIREGTLQYALLDMVRQQSTMTSTASNSNSCDKYLECFQDIIQAHFYHYRQEMVETVEQWAKSWNAQSVPKNKLDKHVEQFREVVWKLKCPDFLDETVAASSQQQQQEEEDGIVLNKTKDDANTSASTDNVFLSLTRSQMEQAAAKGDYITAGRLQLEMKNVQTHGNVASIIATKRQQMEDRASLKDYIGAGEIQKELQYLEQHQTMLCDLEKRMFDAAWKLDFCKAGKIQQQYQLLLQTSSKDEQQLENAAAWRSGVVASTSSMPVGSNPKVMPTDGMWPEEEEEHDDDYYDEEDMDEMHQVLFGVDGVYQGNY